MAAAVGGCIALASLYLLCAVRIYVSNAKLLVDQNDISPLADNQRMMPSESFVQTQADILASKVILDRALKSVDYRSLKTFAKSGADPAIWLQKSGALKVDVARKSDVIIVSMESPYPNEAARFANAVVDAYVAQQADIRRTSGLEMVGDLEKQKVVLREQRSALEGQMQQFRKEHEAVSFANDRANSALERSIALSASFTAAQTTTMDLRAQKSAVERALADPQMLKGFVESQQFKQRDTGDHEFDELRAQLLQEMLLLSTVSSTQGPSNPRVVALERVVSGLQQRIAEKERAIAQAHLVAVKVQLAAAEENERQLREAVTAQRSQLVELGPTADRVAQLQGDLARIQKQSDLLESRIAEIKVNQIDAPVTNAHVIEAARPEAKPIKPNSMLMLGVAAILGWIGGIGMALALEWRDARFRSVDQVSDLLGTTVIASVPTINGRLSPVARGQVLFLDSQSPGAEAFRSIRTSLHLGLLDNAKNILVASALPGEGRSTTASNLAIAFAQAGHRTLLIDCDMREPVQHLIHEADGAVGLTSVIAGEATLRKAVVPTRVSNLYLLPCGPVPANPTNLLTGKRFEQMMSTLCETFDRIVIDSPPLLIASDARVLAAAADATMLVLRMNHSVQRAGILAMDELTRVGANVIGAVANDAPPVRAQTLFRGAWQYASSAKRVMASVVTEIDVADSPELRSDPLFIPEPQWSPKQINEVSSSQEPPPMNRLESVAAGNGSGNGNGNGRPH